MPKLQKLQPTFYRKRDKQQPTVKRTSVSLNQSCLAGLESIRAAFHRKYPESAYPTLSAILNVVLESEVKGPEKNPKRLAAEVADFERRYPQPSQSSESSESVR